MLSDRSASVYSHCLNTVFIVMAALLFLSACSFGFGDDKPTKANETTAAESPKVSLASYRLSEGDRIKIITVDHTDLSVETNIADDGTVEIPLIGSVKAAGLTVVELREFVTNALNKDYIIDPRVNVEVLKFQPFFMLGQVKNPGKYEYRANMDARQAVAIAGGYTRRADEDKITITRVILGRKKDFDAAKNTLIFPGDVIDVGRRWF